MNNQEAGEQSQMWEFSAPANMNIKSLDEVIKQSLFISTYW